MENEEEDKKSESGPEVDGAVAVAYELNVYICIKISFAFFITGTPISFVYILI